MVHVHFKEEIGVAELIPLVTTYIILFAYIYFSTRESILLTSLLPCVLTHTRFIGLVRFPVCREDRHGEVQVGSGAGCRGNGPQLSAHVGWPVHALRTHADAQRRVRLSLCNELELL